MPGYNRYFSAGDSGATLCAPLSKQQRDQLYL